MFYCLITLPSFHVWLWQLRDGLPKKGVVLLDFVQMRGGGPCPNFLSTFHKLYMLGEFGDGEGGDTPAKKFWHVGVKKKWYKLSKSGGGVEVIWTKSKRTATFFRETFPERD